MSRKLATAVILTDENGQPKIFNAGDEPSKKWADQIDNPKAWETSDDAGDEPAAAPDPEPDEVDEDDDLEDETDTDDGDDSDDDKPPAKNAKLEVWQKYAESKGIELEDGATKKDYQDAVAAL